MSNMSEKPHCEGFTKQGRNCRKPQPVGSRYCHLHEAKELEEKFEELRLEEPIKFFSRTRPYFELSNYYPSSFTLDGLTYSSVEQYYQAMKFYDPDSPDQLEYFHLIVAADSPQKVKDLGRQRGSRFSSRWLVNKQQPELGTVLEAIRNFKNRVAPREDWDAIRVEIMKKGLDEKFEQNPTLRTLLLSTGTHELIEDSPTDSFWGVARGGQNVLGKLLMEVRTELR